MLLISFTHLLSVCANYLHRQWVTSRLSSLSSSLGVLHSGCRIHVVDCCLQNVLELVVLTVKSRERVSWQRFSVTIAEASRVHYLLHGHCLFQQEAAASKQTSMVKYHGRGLDTERQRYISSFNTVQRTSQDRRFAVTSETEFMVTIT